MSKSKKEIVYLKQLIPNSDKKLVYVDDNGNETQITTINQGLKKYYFNPNQELILQIIVHNDNANCNNCKDLQCKKHYSKLKINRSYIDLDREYLTLEELFDLLAESKSKQVSKLASLNLPLIFLATCSFSTLLMTLTYILCYIL